MPFLLGWRPSLLGECVLDISGRTWQRTRLLQNVLELVVRHSSFEPWREVKRWGAIPRSLLLLVASLLLVERPGAPRSVRSLLVAMPFAPFVACLSSLLQVALSNYVRSLCSRCLSLRPAWAACVAGLHTKAAVKLSDTVKQKESQRRFNLHHTC